MLTRAVDHKAMVPVKWNQRIVDNGFLSNIGTSHNLQTAVDHDNLFVVVTDFKLIQFRLIVARKTKNNSPDAISGISGIDGIRLAGTIVTEFVEGQTPMRHITRRDRFGGGNPCTDPLRTHVRSIRKHIYQRRCHQEFVSQK